MIHATVMATSEIFKWVDIDAERVNGRRACDWALVREDSLDALNALALLDGLKVPLPTCPACAALVDLALELRGSK